MMPKFRAWDKAYKMMMVVNQIDFEDRSLWLEADNGDHETRHTITRDFDEVILMQSTGLKDQKGVEIYEGDILYFEPYGTHSNDRVVEYIDGAYHGRLIRSGYLKLLAECVYKTMVIGNIYENPELLGDTDA